MSDLLLLTAVIRCLATQVFLGLKRKLLEQRLIFKPMKLLKTLNVMPNPYPDLTLNRIFKR